MNVSVVMSCYNAEKYIASAIESILNQTFTDFEFIIWNDGSTDRTEEIIKSYDDSRIRYFYHENTGVGYARKLACMEVRSSYIAVMDADDIALPERLQIEYDYLQSHPDVVLVSSAVNFIDDDDNLLGRSFPYTKDRILRKLMSTLRNPFIHPAAMFRRDAYIKTGGYLGIRRALDTLLFARIITYGKVINLPQVLLNYRISADSISTSAYSSCYSPVIIALETKMIMDEHVSEDDVTLFNTIINYSKRENGNEIQNTVNQRIKSNINIIYRMYMVLKPIFGTSLTESFLIALKNMAGYIKTCR